MESIRLANVVVALCISLGSIAAVADEPESGGEEAEAKHSLAVFLGVTRELDENRDTSSGSGKVRA